MKLLLAVMHTAILGRPQVDGVAATARAATVCMQIMSVSFCLHTTCSKR